nr:hypothetical protein CFP56_26277 [Quercus suber]
MATRYCKEKYARIKNLKNEPLSNLTADSNKRKLSNEKVETIALPLVHTTLSTPTPSLEVTAFTPLTTRVKGKGKVGRSVWDNLATAMGRAHNVITNDELKGLLSIPSHELYFKGFELLCRWIIKHHSLAVDFSSLDFEKIDTEILTGKAKELEETEVDAMEKDPFGKEVTEGKDGDESVVPPS